MVLKPDVVMGELVAEALELVKLATALQRKYIAIDNATTQLEIWLASYRIWAEWLQTVICRQSIDPLKHFATSDLTLMTT